jgi:hypothetical protein
MNGQNQVIAPEQVAAKLRDNSTRQEVIANPRLGELLWFLQAISLKPGGLAALAESIIGRFKDELGSLILPTNKERFTKEESITIWDNIPYAARRSFQNGSFEAYNKADSEEEADMWESMTVDWANVPIRTSQRAAISRNDSKPELSRELLIKAFAGFAITRLPELFVELCIDASKNLSPSPWFLPSLMKCLFLFMDDYAEEQRRKMAKTDVAERVFEVLDYAFEATVMVILEGDPRLGKSFSARSWCAMYPGRARMVPVPCHNRQIDLFRAIGEALGIDHRGRTSDLREKVEYTMRGSGLMLVFDEAHFLIPANFTDTTTPGRLNWVRTEIHDRDLPCVLIVTPQSFDTALKKYVKKTSHRFDQFFGRTQTFKISSKISLDQIMAVARFHFPELNPALLKIIAGRAKQYGTSCLQKVEQIAKRARHLARKGGRPNISKEDLMEAMSEDSGSPVNTPAAQPMQTPCTDHAGPEQTNRISARMNAGTETLIPA